MPRLLTMLLMLLVGAAAEAAPISFFDGTFDDEDWMRSVTVLSGPATPLTETAAQMATGGNPDAYRHMTHTWGNNTQALVAHLRVDAVYDPAVHGAIAFLDYSEDQIAIDIPLGGIIGRGLVLEQGGATFLTLADAVFNLPSWQTFVLPGLVPSDFSALDGSDALPDFSVSGDPITFGYWRSNTIPNPVRTVIHGIDNWSVDAVQVIPEPSTALLVGGGFLALGISRRRR